MSGSEVYAKLPRRPGHDDVRLHARGNGRPSSPRRYHAGCRCGWTSGEGTAAWVEHGAIKHMTGLTDMQLLEAAEKGNHVA